jgi:hypothetical protein
VQEAAAKLYEMQLTFELRILTCRDANLSRVVRDFVYLFRGRKIPRQTGFQYMAALVVNIADFRCRDLKGGFGYASVRVVENHVGLRVMETSHTQKTAAPAGNPTVLDISAAGDSQRMRQRMVLHPVAASRPRSNLVRFNEPRVAVMRIRQTRAMESWDDCDHPPAA